jgi:pimeloyl-ACP methyl ester carboxylesterase
MRRGTIEVDGLGVAYREAGDGDRPTLILLHGWPHSSLLYAAVLERLAERLRVLAFDLPGVGDSRGSPASAEKIHIADVMLTAAEKLGGRSILIAGLDVGGMTAFAAARDHATRIVGALVANTVIPGIDPWDKVIADPRIWHFAFHRVPQLPETLVAGHERAYFDFFYDVLAKNPASLSDALRSGMAAAYERPEALHAGFEWYRAFARDAKRNAVHRRIEVPLLYLRGDADGRRIDEYANGLRERGVVNLEQAVIRGSGEYLPVEAPDAFVEQVLRFAQTLER